jgi:hypothetical protein
MNSKYGLSQGKVNTDLEILKDTYATAYDAMNNIMVDRTGTDPSTLSEVRYRFKELKRLAREYAPEKLKYIEKLEMYSIAHLEGKLSEKEYLEAIRTVSELNGVQPDMLYSIEGRVGSLERRSAQGPPTFMPEFKVPQFKMPSPKARAPKAELDIPQPRMGKLPEFKLPRFDIPAPKSKQHKQHHLPEFRMPSIADIMPKRKKKEKQRLQNQFRMPGLKMGKLPEFRMPELDLSLRKKRR